MNTIINRLIFIMATLLLFAGCDDSLQLISSVPYTDPGGGGATGSYAVGDSLEPGGDDASMIAGVWMMTHMDGADGSPKDDAIDIATEGATLHTKVYELTTDYIYNFYSSSDGTQEGLGLGTESEFHYSASENIWYSISSSDKVTNVFSMVVRVNEVVNGTAVSVLYMKIPAGGGTYIRLEKQANDYLP